MDVREGEQWVIREEVWTVWLVLECLEEGGGTGPPTPP